VRDSDPKFQVAKLVFDPNAIGPNTVPGWHRDAFDLRLSLVQVIQVNGVGPKDLMINLTCTEHQQQIANHFAATALFATEKVITVASAFAAFIKRAFARPPHPGELHGHEASTPTQ